MVRPKRRKHKDNPYLLAHDNASNTYSIKFIDGRGKNNEVDVQVEVFEMFDYFELEDKSQMNEYDRHIEHFEINENVLYCRMKNPPEPLNDSIINKIIINDLREALKSLPEIQRRRLMLYYFEDKTLEKIAQIEGCSKVAVKYSIDIALTKLKKMVNR